MSESPEKPSIGLDAILNRIATLGVFTMINSGKEIVVYNSHFDHIGGLKRKFSEIDIKSYQSK